jgi:hypothetical protein
MSVPRAAALAVGFALCLVVLPERSQRAWAGAKPDLPRAPVIDAVYGWPLRPFDRQHPIRSGFGDPRFGVVERNFHFGVDIAAPGGTPVYAVAPGIVYREIDHVDVFSDSELGRGIDDGFSYWHIAPAVREHAFVRRGALLGYVKPFWEHVHFAQMIDGQWINPLRAVGGLRPYVDRTWPTVAFVHVVAQGVETNAFPAGTRAAIIASAYDVPPPPVPQHPYERNRVAPALLRWRLIRAGHRVSHWRTAVDFRLFLPPNSRFGSVYAHGTTENRAGEPGRYFYDLEHGSTAAHLAPGRYRVEVEAFSIRGRRSDAATLFTVHPR